jgi:electron transport complex protein RnfC
VLGEGPSCAVHASISGNVTEIDKTFTLLTGETATAVTIDATPPKGPSGQDLKDLQPMGKILRSGLNDFSPGGLPLLEKIARAQEKRVHTLIINGLDEFLVQGYQSSLLTTKTQEVLNGISLLQEIIGAETVYIALYAQATQALTALQEQNTSFVVKPLQAKHPQHRDKLLVSVIAKQEYPPEIAPEDLGISIIGVETAYALNRVVTHNEPVISKLVTIAGSGLETPRNLEVKIGTPIQEVLEYIGYDTQSIGKIIVGGPLSGRAIYDPMFPITKETHILYIQHIDSIVTYTSNVCIKCGYCVEVCPMRLMPFLISGFSEGGHFELAEKNDIFSCIECGCCAYVCPARIPMVQWIQLGKSVITAQRSTEHDNEQTCSLA